MSEELKVGDVVRVAEPDHYITAFANKIRDRDGVVEWIGPDKWGQFKNLCWVKFGKRNGRGKEFRERMDVRNLIVQNKEKQA